MDSIYVDSSNVFDSIKHSVLIQEIAILEPQIEFTEHKLDTIYSYLRKSFAPINCEPFIPKLKPFDFWIIWIGLKSSDLGE